MRILANVTKDIMGLIAQKLIAPQIAMNKQDKGFAKPKLAFACVKTIGNK